MEYKKGGIIVLAITIGIGLSMPAKILGAGRFIIHPKFTAGWQVESNYFRSETDEQEVFTYLLQPGIEVGYETSKSLLTLDYSLNAFIYDSQDSVPPDQPDASDDDYLGHTANFQAETRPIERLLVGLDNSFLLTRNPAQTDSLGDFTERDKYWINRLTPGLYYELSRRFDAGLRYRNTIIHWLEGLNEDTDENRAILDLIYNLSPTAHLNLDYQYWRRDYDGDTSDYISNQIMLIFRKQFKYISFEGGAGYQNRRFDSSDLDDIDTPVFLGAIIGQFPPAPDPPTSHFTLMFDQNFNDQGVGQRYYVARRLTLKAGHVFLEKIVLELEGWFQNSDYEDTFGLTSSGEIEKRDDDRYYFFGSIGYRFKDWLTFSAGGGYDDRDSNIENLSFDNSFFRTQLDFDFKF